MWLCPAEGAATIQTMGLDNLTQWMMDEHTDPDIQHTILTCLTQHFNHLPLTPIAMHLECLQNALHSQDALGWDNFFEGCMVIDWERAQDVYYHWCHSKKSGRRWTTALIQKLWDIAWDLWEHWIRIVHSLENVCMVCQR